MGRSVSYLQRAAEVAYIDFDGMYYDAESECYNCAGNGCEYNGVGAQGVSLPCDVCRGTGHIERQPDEHDWDHFCKDLYDVLHRRFPSLQEADHWDKCAHSETRIFAENEFGEFGISEYFGLVSVSMRVKFDDDWEYAPKPLAVSWVTQVGRGFHIAIEQAYSDKALRKLGSFSNGEGVFASA